MNTTQINESREYIENLRRNRNQNRTRSLDNYYKNADEINEKRRAERKDKTSKISIREKLYKRDSDVSKKARRTWEIKKLKTDPKFKLIKGLRIRLHKALKFQNTLKNNQTMEYIGCTKQELKTHLENLFIDGMTWDNYGVHGWHVDHIKPISKFDLSLEEEIYKAMNYKNLQPLWAIDNIRKSDTWIEV